MLPLMGTRGGRGRARARGGGRMDGHGDSYPAPVKDVYVEVHEEEYGGGGGGGGGGYQDNFRADERVRAIE
jgi:hypothetical protein